jgi:hypothetical protein
LFRFLLPVDASKQITLLWIVLTPLMAYSITFLALPATRAWIDWGKLRKFTFRLK